jgi:type IV pilus assembly protein PilA
MKNKAIKAFTLIELLVVVAIIGILAAVGVVAYNGYVEGAKTSVTKSTHSAVSKYIAAESQKCNISGGTAMNGLLTCSSKNATNVITALTNTSTGMAKEFKNPFVPDAATSITSGGAITADTDAGYIRLSASGTQNVVVSSCNKTPCSDTANQATTTVSLQ